MTELPTTLARVEAYILRELALHGERGSQHTLGTLLLSSEKEAHLRVLLSAIWDVTHPTPEKVRTIFAAEAELVEVCLKAFSRLAPGCVK